MIEIDENFRKRFDAKWVKDETSGCWLWTASIAGQNGYGQIKLPRQRRQEYAHRISYMIHKGEIPKGKMVCHTCDTPRCVNPEHLFVGSSSDNHLDMKAKGRHLYGERNKSAKLTEDQVKQILLMLDSGVSHARIARAFDVSATQIFRIGHGFRWSHLKSKGN